MQLLTGSGQGEHLLGRRRHLPRGVNDFKALQCMRYRTCSGRAAGTNVSAQLWSANRFHRFGQGVHRVATAAAEAPTDALAYQMPHTNRLEIDVAGQKVRGVGEREGWRPRAEFRGVEWG